MSEHADYEVRQYVSHDEFLAKGRYKVRSGGPKEWCELAREAKGCALGGCKSR